MLVRTQMNFSATGEILAPYALGHYVGGGMRGSHQMRSCPFHSARQLRISMVRPWLHAPPSVFTTEN
jgi:fructose 1,6-bisphosphatase